MLLPVQGAWAVDADTDGSDSVEESLAGTSDNDATQRPYWWKTFDGDRVSAYMGNSVSGAGDVNGDGYADLIVGAEGGGPGEQYGSGAAWVFSGADGSILHYFSDVLAGRFDDFGSSVSGAGDVNGDGYADLIVGMEGSSFYQNYARVFSGLDGSILYTFLGANRSNFGVSVSGAGDVNGDGYADLIVGAENSDGGGTNPYARVYSGIDGSILYILNGPNIPIVVIGDPTTSLFGSSVSGAGDVNGDGYADVIVGAPHDDINGYWSGFARVFSGADGSILYTFSGDAAYDNLGQSVGGAGDVNGDGKADLIVGYAGHVTGSPGAARVFSGADGSILYNFYGDSASDLFGKSVSGAGDVNGDGRADLIVGAKRTDYNNTVPGYARVFSGADGSILYTFHGDGATDLFGGSVSGAGDVDGDGRADLIVGAIGDSNNFSYSGSARVFLSSDLMNDGDTDHRIDTTDNCPTVPNFDQADTDLDGIGDSCDNCISIANPGQETSALNPDCGLACETSGCGGPRCQNH